MILAADVGGTKSHLALFHETSDGLAAERETVLDTRSLSSLPEAVREFAGGDVSAVASGVLGVAGPVLSGRVRGANLPWEVNAADLSEALAGAPVRLLNDLEASAYGLDEARDLATLQAGVEDPEGNRALVSPGTGLGEAILFRHEGGYSPVPSEAGHGDFAARTEEEIDLLGYLKSRHGRVSWERVLSGPGIVNVFLWLRETRRLEDDSAIEAHPDHAEHAGKISGAAIAGSSRICSEAMRVWVSALGAEAGNVALRALPSGGLFLGGGIAPRILPLLRGENFLEAFRAKAPQAEMMLRFPVHVVLESRTALLGAARVALELARTKRSP